MMNYADYIQHISFRFYQPMMFPKGFTRVSQVLRLFNMSFEIWNTRLPEHTRESRQKLAELLHIPRMSTYAIGAILNEGVARLQDDQCFVNVGVWHGFTLLSGMIGNAEKTCIGIDNFSGFDSPSEITTARFEKYKSARHFLYKMDYRAYFAEHHRGQIGLYLYDGDHSYDNQLHGLRVAEPYFSEHCCILVDDTNREEPRQATLDFMKASAGKYQILLDQNTCIPDHPTFWDGIMIVQRVS